MRIAIIIRQLEGFDPVAHGIIKEHDSPRDLDDIDGYLKSKANEKIEEFTKKFVEFNKARFYVQIMDI